jgi:hypothetical protein
MKNFSQDSRSLGRDLHPGPPEYETGMLTTRTATFDGNFLNLHLGGNLFESRLVAGYLNNFLQVNTEIVPRNWPLPHPSKFIPTRHL